VRRLLLAAVLTACMAADAQGSFVIPPAKHQIDPSHRASDRKPPSPPTLSVLAIARGHGPRRHALSIDHLGGVQFRVISKDDRTFSRNLGYRIVSTGGTLPNGFRLPAWAVRASRFDSTGVGSISIAWNDGAADVQEPFDFRIIAIAVDLGGNESSPSETLRVAHPGSTQASVAKPGVKRP
jgi:hypothetical protein